MLATTKAIALLNLLYAIETTFVKDIIEFSKAANDASQIEEITFLDILQENDQDDSLFYIQDFLRQQPNRKMRFLSSNYLNLTSNDFESSSHKEAVLTNSKDSMLLKRVSKGLLETLVWFAPADVDLTGMKLRLDSQMYLYSIFNHTIILQEAFAIKNGSNLRQSVGIWTLEGGIKISEPIIWERRKDLSSLTMVNAMILTSTLPASSVKKTNSGVIETSGYFPAILNLLSENLRFKIVNVLSPDGKFGSKNSKNGTWNGIVGMLDRKEADVTTSGMNIIQERSLVIDFTIPIDTTRMTLLVKKSSGGGTVNFWAYIKTFTVTSYIAIGLSTVVLIVALVAIGRAGVEDKDEFSLINCAGLVLNSLLQKDINLVRTRNSSHIMVFVIFMFFYMIFNYFNTFIISYMTVLEATQTIRSFKDVLTHDYHVVIMKGSSFETYLLGSEPNSDLYQIYISDMKDRPEAFLDTLEEGLDAIRKNPKMAFFGNSLYFYGMHDIVPLKLTDSIPLASGLGLQKDSEFTKMFNHFLLKMDQVGIKRKISDQWFNNTSDASGKVDSNLETIVLSYENVLFPFIVLFCGVLLALCSVVFEVLLRK